MTVLMGRRRIGKTELSQRCGDETILYFFVGKKTESLLCRDFIAEIANKLGVPVLGQANMLAYSLRKICKLNSSKFICNCYMMSKIAFGVLGHFFDSLLSWSMRRKALVCRKETLALS